MLKWGFLALFTIIFVAIVYEIFESIKKKKLSNLIKEEFAFDEETETLRTGINLVLSPSTFIEEMQKVSVSPYGKQQYISRFILGGLVGFFVSYVLYRSLYISIVGAIIIGFVYPYFGLVKRQNAYRDQLKAKLIHYFKLFSSYMRSTNYNIIQSLEYCIEGIDAPLKGDLERVLYDLKQGADPKKAFGYLNEKYPYQGVELFHHLALLVAEQGRDDHESLKEASIRFGEKRYWQNKLEQNNKKQVRDRNGVMIFSLSIYLMLMFMTNEYYTSFIVSMVGIITITLSLLFYGLTIYSQKGLMEVDPTEVKK